MGKNYELKRIDEEVWEQTPEHIQEMRRRFSFLRDEITKSNKRIEKYQSTIRKTKIDKKEYEKERTLLYHKLVTFQIGRIPTVSPTVQPGNNYQWSINLTIGDVKRKKYLGSNKKVRERLDEIYHLDIFTSTMNSLTDDLTEHCRKEVRKIVQKNLMKEMETEKDLVIIFKKWKKDQLKMWDYLK
jgi:hypothetical protein